MKKLKRMLSGFLALALVLSVLLNSRVVASAEETEALENVLAETENVEVEEETAPAENAEEEDTSAENVEEASTSIEADEDLKTAAGETIEALLDEMSEEIGAVVPVAEQDDDGLTVEITSEVETVDMVAEEYVDEVTDPDSGISLASMLPLEERKAYLVLSGYSEEEIQAISLDTILNSLQDADGNSIEIAEDATAVWTYFKDEDDNIIQDEYHVIGRDETVDLSIFADVSTYTMELIIGSGQQLDAGNIRYLVTVYLSTEIQEKISYELYTQDANGVRTEIIPSKIQTEEVYLADYGVTAETAYYTVPNHLANTEYYLGITSVAAEHPDIKVEVYDYWGYIFHMYGIDNPITDQILDQSMKEKDAGYKGIYDGATDTASAMNNMFFIIYKNASSGAEISTQVVAFSVVTDISYIYGDIYSFDGAEMSEIVCYEANSFDVSMDDWAKYLDTESANGLGLYGLYYMLDKGYSADEEWYCALTAHGTVYGDEANRYVTKAVVGLYDSLEEAATQEDIKEQLLPTDTGTTPYGYKANYNYESGGVYFTVFFEDGSIFKMNVRIMEYDSRYDKDYVESFTNAPIIGEPDPWFRITGVNDPDGKALDTYVVENGKAINMDTMYGYGYQTILVKLDSANKISRVQPVFEYADSDEVKVTNIFLNGRRFNQGDTVELTGPETTVTFSVIIEDGKGLHTKNYNVTFVCQTSGAQLFVAGPDTQEVFLDEYFEYKHDILIANVGNEMLTGLKVELNATNCKLDDYWTVGGKNNDTLAPFDAVTSNAKYGELANLAKIRLLPDGEGDIEGTLTISADGQEPVVITLTGRAQNPQVVTTELADAVKYVPYSYLVTTNNMYDWTDVTFTMTGDLPEGVDFISSTGELYGVPQETGEFPISVTADFTSETYSFESSTVNLILTVKDNTNDNVYNETDEGYSIEESIGTDVGGHDFVLEDYGDEVFWSEGELGQFVDLWLNGEKLEKNVDYIAEDGSTKITIYKQTFDEKANQNGTNTLAAEFRTLDTESKNNANNTNELKRTAQNFRIETLSDDDSNKPVDPSKPVDPNKPVDPVNPSDPSEPVNPGVPGNSEGSGDTGSDGNNGDLSNTDNTGSTKGGTDTASQTVTMIAYVVDADGKPLADHTVEIHSTVKTGVTDQKGFAAFRSVDFGAHTITVKTPDGNTEAKKNFTLQSGTSLSLSGSTITAKAGNTFTLTLQLNDGELTLLSVQSGDLSASPTTGDTAVPVLWLMLLAVACAGFVTISKTPKQAGRRTKKCK